MEIKKINNETYWCCPHCDTQLMSDTVNASRTVSGASIFFDGDTIQVDTTYHAIFTDSDFSSALDVGKCTKCFEYFFSISMTFGHFLPEAVDRVSKQSNFIIYQKNLKNSDKYQNFKCFCLNIYDCSIGTQYDIRLCILPLMPNEAKDLIGIYGVSSYGNSDVWQRSTNIVEEFLQNHQDLILNILSGGILENITDRTNSTFAEEASI